MNNIEIKNALLDLTSIVLEIQTNTSCPTHISMHPYIGNIRIIIGNEMEQRPDFFNPLYEVNIYYFDEWANESFMANYQAAKIALEKILQECAVINS